VSISKISTSLYRLINILGCPKIEKKTLSKPLGKKICLDNLAGNSRLEFDKKVLCFSVSILSSSICAACQHEEKLFKRDS
jgi:hypothetical protein